jgi:Fe-S-cluster-containing dehydrogenase component
MADTQTESTPKPKREKRYAMAIDTRRCVGCSACVIACKTENKVPAGFFRDWLEEELHGTFPNLTLEIRSNRCQHCSEPPCVTACPTGASFIADGGITLVSRNKCTGCKACIAACPYDARYVHPDGYVDKCTFCIHRLQKGLLPACVTVCPTKAMVFGDTNDPDSDISKLLRDNPRVKQLKTESGCKPNLYFLY